MAWIKCTDRLPPANIFVNTKIDDERGQRNEQKLKLVGRLWLATDGEYVYYEPTHWQFPK